MESNPSRTESADRATRLTAPRNQYPLRHLVDRDAHGDRDPKPSGQPTRLSILVPVYNEERTLQRAVESLLEQRYPVDVELCVVDDGSTDGTREILGETCSIPRGSGVMPGIWKGAALMTAGAMATGTHMVPFDADLEYSAEDLPRMLAPIIDGRCESCSGRAYSESTRVTSRCSMRSATGL